MRQDDQAVAHQRKIGSAIRRERTRLGLSQERLAELSHLNPRSIQRIEAGEIGLLATTLIRIQKALGSSWKDLLP